MSDPTRLIDEPGHSLEAALLRAVRADAPAARAHNRMLKTLGIGATTSALMMTTKAAAVAGVTCSKPAAVGLTGTFIVKCAIVTSLSTLVAIGVARQFPALLGRSAPSPSELPRGANAVVNRVESKLPEAPLPPSEHNDPKPPSELARPLLSAEKSAGSARSPAASKLAHEVAALDRAREAAAQRNPAYTLKLLDAYQRQFPNGSLLPEAQLLRIEALVQSGRRTQAQPIARSLLQSAPDGPLSERIHTLMPEVE